MEQEDSLTPFPFLLMVEGLSGDVRSVETCNLLSGIRVGNVGLSMTHLQYADDICSSWGSIG